jgi:ubiquitin-protein ligase
MLLQAQRRRRLPLHNCVSRKVCIHHLGSPPCFQPFCTDLVLADLSELALPSTMKTDFPDPDDTLNFTLTIEPDEGMYKGGRFHFTFAIPQSFPHEAPKVKCTQKIYHPNIDLEGNVCLNILREDWKPVLNLNAVIIGLQVCCGEDSPIATLQNLC